MTTVTGFIGKYADGSPAKTDAHGNNVAFDCPSCGHPVLAVVREHQRGSSRTKPAVCIGCGNELVVQARPDLEQIIIYRVSEL